VLEEARGESLLSSGPSRGYLEHAKVIVDYPCGTVCGNRCTHRLRRRYASGHFTCYPEPCVSVPTAPDITFPSQTLDITLLGAFFSVTLNSSDLPDDNYVWNLQFKDSTGHGGPAIPEIAISDVTNGTAGDVGQTSDPLIGSSTNEEGCLTFTSTCPLPTPPPVSTPEPGTPSLMLVGSG
jgi:hypothetical protein